METTKGMAIPIYMPRPDYLLVVKGKKTEVAVVQYLDERVQDLEEDVREALKRYHKLWKRKDLNEYSRFLRSRRYYLPLKDFIFSEREKHPDLPDTKRDLLSFPGGEIEPNELRDFPDNYAAYAVSRELAEESGLLAQESEEIHGKRVIHDLFDLVGRFYTDDFDLEEENYQYENWVYWIRNVNNEQLENKDRNGFPKPRDTGATDETFPAFYIRVERLAPYNFHMKHGDILGRILQQKVADGHVEYQQAADHLTKYFPESPRIVLEKPKYTPPAKTIETPVSAEEEFLDAMEGVKRL